MFAKTLAFIGLLAVPGVGQHTAQYYRPQHSRLKPAQAPLAPGSPVVVNAASYLAGISPGGLATVFGEDLTSVNGVVLAGTDPLPTVLAGVEVSVNGRSAPIFGVAFANGEDQVSFQVPYSTPVGPDAALVEVFDHGEQVASIFADSFTEDPGIFTYSGDFALAASGVDGSLIGPDNPALPGEALVLYTTGLGPVSLNLRDGFGAPFNPLARTVSPLHVFIESVEASVDFSGLTPGYVGLYQTRRRRGR